jgi:hypothetical protein
MASDKDIEKTLLTADLATHNSFTIDKSRVDVNGRSTVWKSLFPLSLSNLEYFRRKPSRPGSTAPSLAYKNILNPLVTSAQDAILAVFSHLLARYQQAFTALSEREEVDIDDRRTFLADEKLTIEERMILLAMDDGKSLEHDRGASTGSRADIIGAICDQLHTFIGAHDPYEFKPDPKDPVVISLKTNINDALVYFRLIFTHMMTVLVTQAAMYGVQSVEYDIPPAIDIDDQLLPLYAAHITLSDEVVGAALRHMCTMIVAPGDQTGFNAAMLMARMHSIVLGDEGEDRHGLKQLNEKRLAMRAQSALAFEASAMMVTRARDARDYTARGPAVIDMTKESSIMDDVNTFFWTVSAVPDGKDVPDLVNLGVMAIHDAEQYADGTAARKLIKDAVADGRATVLEHSSDRNESRNMYTLCLQVLQLRAMAMLVPTQHMAMDVLNHFPARVYEEENNKNAFVPYYRVLQMNIFRLLAKNSAKIAVKEVPYLEIIADSDDDDNYLEGDETNIIIQKNMLLENKASVPLSDIELEVYMRRSDRPQEGMILDAPPVYIIPSEFHTNDSNAYYEALLGRTLVKYQKFGAEVRDSGALMLVEKVPMMGFLHSELPVNISNKYRQRGTRIPIWQIPQIMAAATRDTAAAVIGDKIGAADHVREIDALVTVNGDLELTPAERDEISALRDAFLRENKSARGRVALLLIDSPVAQHKGRVADVMCAMLVASNEPDLDGANLSEQDVKIIYKMLQFGMHKTELEKRRTDSYMYMCLSLLLRYTDAFYPAGATDFVGENYAPLTDAQLINISKSSGDDINSFTKQVMALNPKATQLLYANARSGAEIEGSGLTIDFLLRGSGYDVQKIRRFLHIFSREKTRFFGALDALCAIPAPKIIAARDEHPLLIPVILRQALSRTQVATAPVPVSMGVRAPAMIMSFENEVDRAMFMALMPRGVYSPVQDVFTDAHIYSLRARAAVNSVTEAGARAKQQWWCVYTRTTIATEMKLIGYRQADSMPEKIDPLFVVSALRGGAQTVVRTESDTKDILFIQYMMQRRINETEIVRWVK